MSQEPVVELTTGKEMLKTDVQNVFPFRLVKIALKLYSLVSNQFFFTIYYSCPSTDKTVRKKLNS